MKILTKWLREYLPELPVSDVQLAEDLTLRGIAVDGVFDLPPNQGLLFEMDITTNRVDAMNHYGIAREMGAIYSVPLYPIDATLRGIPEEPGAPGLDSETGVLRANITSSNTIPPAGAPFIRASSARMSGLPETPAFSVRIEEPDLCGRFTARILRDVTIGPSTGALAAYFGLLEQKLISNAVDATNYVTLAIGQPTHAFDLDKITGGLTVRRARKGERLRTLDGVDRTLDADDLIVADDLKPVALAGVMGGYDTMITTETRNIVVEAAWFDPATVRRSSRRHGLHTDASHRFERGADFNAPPVANALVSRIILESGGAQHGDFIDTIVPAMEVRTASRPPIRLQLREVRRILGATEDPTGITTAGNILTALGCSLTQQSAAADAEYQVTLPSWRLDLEREIDLIEEIARVYGYNRFANTLPAFAGAVVELPWAEKESTVRRTLLAHGYNEAVFSTFCSAADAAAFEPQPNSAIALGNPLSEDAGMLRPSLLPGMLQMLQNNLNRDVEDVALFEMGTVFHGNPDKVEERPSLALGATGRVSATGPHQLAPAYDFYHLKGAVEAVLGRFASRSLYYDSFPAATGLLPAWLHPGRCARAVMDGTTVAWFGQLHPGEAHRRKLRQLVFLAELYLDRLYHQSLHQPVVRELSRYQAVRRDYSVVFPDSVQWATIAAAIKGLSIPELTNFEPREILRDLSGLKIPKGSYSVLISATFQSPDKTLREEDLQHFSQAIIASLDRLGGHLRSI